MQKGEKKNIRHLLLPEIQEEMLRIGEPKFRAAQIWDWLWAKHAKGFAEMSNLPAALREKLAGYFDCYAMTIGTEQKSKDGTMKFGFRLYDGDIVEGVLIPAGDRMTACVSSQVGCSLACTFCATARLPRKRNLFFDEIYDQVAHINAAALKHYGQRLSNIVFMGMGEPLLNYSQVVKGIERITAPDGLGMAPKRITVSTAGVAKMIKKLADDGTKVNLALSLHAANDEKRDKIMGINETNKLEDLKDALRYFYDKTETRITLEYVLLRGFNDTPQDAEELAQFARVVPTKINLIEYNPIEGGEFGKSLPRVTDAFLEILERHKLIVNIRRSRGEDIDAACGQLANREQPVSAA